MHFVSEHTFFSETFLLSIILMFCKLNVVVMFLKNQVFIVC